MLRSYTIARSPHVMVPCIATAVTQLACAATTLLVRIKGNGYQTDSHDIRQTHSSHDSSGRIRKLRLEEESSLHHHLRDDNKNGKELRSGNDHTNQSRRAALHDSRL